MSHRYPLSSEHDNSSSLSRAVLDETALEKLRSLGILQHIGERYLDVAPKLINDTCLAIEKGDLESVRETCHTLKSSCANLGAKEFSNICGQLEQAARKHNSRECLDLRASFINSHEGVLLALKAQISALGDSRRSD